jgi:DNA-binding CsgD family transcriptional regulator
VLPADPATLDWGVDADLAEPLPGNEGDVLDLLALGHPPAFASDSRNRIVFWNRGAAELLKRKAQDALGRHCYEVTCGRDVFGNRYCYANCAVAASVRAGDEVHAFELDMSADGHGRRLMGVTILRIPSVRPDLFTVLHILQPIEEGGRLSRELRRLAAQEGTAPNGGTSPSDRIPVDAEPVPLSLTRREREILGWVAAGLQNKEVAQKLDLSPSTVRNHVHSILDKLAVHSKLEAVCLAFRSGWVLEPGSAPRP